MMTEKATQSKAVVCDEQPQQQHARSKATIHRQAISHKKRAYELCTMYGVALLLLGADGNNTYIQPCRADPFS